MSDKTGIEWADATPMYDADRDRIRYYKRLDPSRPGQQLRRKMAAEGKKWCRSCAAWLPSEQVSKNGMCRPHENEAYRNYYQNKGKAAIRQRVHARKRGVAPLPVIAQGLLMEQFGGCCAYCKTEPASTWDHVVPVVAGGETVPGNMVPACNSCNSSKKIAMYGNGLIRKACPSLMKCWMLLFCWR